MRAFHLSVQFNQAEVKLWFPLFLLHHCERLCHPLFLNFNLLTVDFIKQTLSNKSKAVLRVSIGSQSQTSGFH